MGKQAGRHAVKQSNRQAGRQVGKQSVKQSNRQAGRQAVGQAVKQAGRQIGMYRRQVVRQASIKVSWKASRHRRQAGR